MPSKILQRNAVAKFPQPKTPHAYLCKLEPVRDAFPFAMHAKAFVYVFLIHHAQETLFTLEFQGHFLANRRFRIELIELPEPNIFQEAENAISSNSR